MSAATTEPFQFLLPARGRGTSLVVEAGGADELEPLFPEEMPPRVDAWVEKRRREYRAGRHAARSLLRELGLDAHRVTRDADGVPSFPAGFSGSITHTGRQSTFAAAVLCPDVIGVGIDAEDAQILEPELQERVLSSEEAHALVRFGGAAQNALLVFSAKEAFYKCVYPRERTFLGFLDVKFELVDVETSNDERRGHFRVSTALLSNSCPRTLDGRFIETPERTLTLVSWT